MKKTLFAALAALAVALPAAAHDYTLGALKIAHPAIPAPLTRAMSAAGYFTIANTGTTSDRLVAIEADIARRVELHTTEHGSDGSAKMVHVEALEIPPGGEVQLSHGGYHVMFMGLTQALAEGTRVPGTLVFEKAGRVAVEFAVEAPRKSGAAEDHSGHAHDAAPAKDASKHSH